MITADGSYTFDPIHQQWTAQITVQPDGQNCSPEVFGVDALGNYTPVAIVCTTLESELKGTVTNLAEGLTLVLTATPTNEDLAVTVQGSIAFEQAILATDDWTVSVKTQPEGFTCVATEGDDAGYSAANDDPPDGINFDCSTPSAD